MLGLRYKEQCSKSMPYSATFNPEYSNTEMGGFTIYHSKFKELKSILQEYVEGETDLSFEEIEKRAYEYYESGELSPSQYDNILGIIEEWKQ